MYTELHSAFRGTLQCTTIRISTVNSPISSDFTHRVVFHNSPAERALIRRHFLSNNLYRYVLECALCSKCPRPYLRYALECQQYARYAVHTHDTTLSQHALLSSIRPCGAAPTAGPARGSTGIPASASSTGRTRTGGRTARRGASSGWRSTRCTWSRLRCSTRERRGGR